MFLLNSSIVSVTRVFLVSNTLYTCRTRKYTHVGVFLCSVSFLRPTTHAEHETTPSLVWFRVRHRSFALRHMPSTKRNPRWCLVVFGVIPLPSNTRRTRKNTNEGVFSCSALFFRPTTHAEHEITPSLVWFRVRHHHFVLPLMPNTSSLRPTTHAEHDKTPSLVSIVFGIFSQSYHTRRARQCTLVGVFSCLTPFLPL